MTTTNEKMDRKEYVEQNRFLAQLEAEAYKSFDAALLAISSGAIALSVAFVEKFSFSIFLYLLIFAWFLWLASIFLQLGSYIASQKAMREEQTILGEQYKDYEKPARKNPYSGVSTTLNILALSVFAAGAISFLLFVMLNIGIRII